MITDIVTSRKDSNNYIVEYSIDGNSNKLLDLNYEFREKIILKLLDAQLSKEPAKVKEIKYIKAQR